MGVVTVANPDDQDEQDRVGRCELESLLFLSLFAFSFLLISVHAQGYFAGTKLNSEKSGYW